MRIAKRVRPVEGEEGGGDSIFFSASISLSFGALTQLYERRVVKGLRPESTHPFPRSTRSVISIVRLLSGPRLLNPSNSNVSMQNPRLELERLSSSDRRDLVEITTSLRWARE